MARQLDSSKDWQSAKVFFDSLQKTPAEIEDKADQDCYEKISTEIKSFMDLADKEEAQVRNYPDATGLRLGLLIYSESYRQLACNRLVEYCQIYS